MMPLAHRQNCTTAAFKISHEGLVLGNPNFSSLWSCWIKGSSPGRQEHRWDGDKASQLQIYSSTDIMMTPIPKTFRQRAVLILNEYGMGHVCQEWDIPHSWQREGRKEPFCKQQGLCYRPAELKKLREHLHLAKPAWKQAADKVSLQVGVLKPRQEVSQDLPLTKIQFSEKELATINAGTCTKWCPQTHAGFFCPAPRPHQANSSSAWSKSPA